MNQNNKSFLRRAHKDQRGQALVMVAFMMVGFFAMAAFVIDFGRIYFSFRELQASTDAAALAGAEAMPTGATAADTKAAVQANVTLYSGVAGNNNAYPNLTGVTMSYTLSCLTTLSNEGIACVESPAGDNAIQVVQTVKVPLTFASIIGTPSITLTAAATAAMRGATGGPYNVMMVLDTTSSMGSNLDTNCTVPGITGSPTREQCALYGVQTLLGLGGTGLAPCAPTLANCGTATNGNVANPFDEVGLMVFPGLTPTETSTLSNPPVQAPTASDDYTCPTSNPSITSYNNNPGYLVLPLQSNYRSSDAATALNTAAGIVIATGGAGGTCKGLATPGGEGTFYAGAITAAQNYLVANSRKNVQNVMIVLSDGDATASSTQMGGKATSYPATNECHQAITASTNAQAAGILVYSVAYGSESSGCSADSPAIAPCATMEGIASLPTAKYFFADNNQSGSGIDKTCANAARPTSDLNQVFKDIVLDLTVARLIPNNTT
ncbi:MAG: pilus assembly protein TadG-related protein [Terriglobia bacterium]|jgi:Flp pilus assembly protein TadG